LTEEEFDALRLVEALLFASAEPVPEAALAAHFVDAVDLAPLLARLQSDYAGRGVNLVVRDGAWAFRTAADLADRLRIERIEPRKPSRAAGGTLDVLIEAGWIKPGKRRETPGRPGTWVTTPGFLDHFGLSSLADLPGVEELKAAGLLDKRPAIQVETDAEPGAGEGEDEGSGSLF
jgi:segregation and condensation protein B